MSERGVITTDNTEIWNIIRECYEQIHVKKVGNPKTELLETHNLPRLNHEEIENLNMQSLVM